MFYFGKPAVELGENCCARSRWPILGFDADIGCKALDEIDGNSLQIWYLFLYFFIKFSWFVAIGYFVLIFCV